MVDDDMYNEINSKVDLTSIVEIFDPMSNFTL